VKEAEMCGWVADKYWVSWQLIPANFTEYMKSGESEKKIETHEGRHGDEATYMGWDRESV
jgi:predicted 3-demethylubiquinone-9 3-methyltransferase (glyoxalase superfamily)